MLRATITLTCSLVAVLMILTHQAESQEIAPAPPAADVDVPTSELSIDLSEPLPLPEVNDVACALLSPSYDAATEYSEYQPAATCCEPEPYRCCCCGHENCFMPGIHHRKRNGKLSWCRVWTTGDMYQHYAYYPAHHGTYYFRPYNYTNILQHKEQIVMLGGERQHPYSVAMFDGFYEHYYSTNPKIEIFQVEKADLPGASRLPNLEDLLHAQ